MIETLADEAAKALEIVQQRCGQIVRALPALKQEGIEVGAHIAREREVLEELKGRVAASNHHLEKNGRILEHERKLAKEGLDRELMDTRRQATAQLDADLKEGRARLKQLHDEIRDRKADVISLEALLDSDREVRGKMFIAVNEREAAVTKREQALDGRDARADAQEKANVATLAEIAKAQKELGAGQAQLEQGWQELRRAQGDLQEQERRIAEARKVLAK